MPNIITVNGQSPIIHPSCFIADDAVITGNVNIAQYCSIWFKAVIRGDVCTIKLGEKVNIQDGCIIHGTLNKSNTIIGNRTSIGHGAIIHGCTIEEDVLIGMGAIIMDNAKISKNVVVAAGSVVLENSQLESGYLYAGTPAKKKKLLDAETINFYISRTAEAYINYASWYQKND